ncbi:MAG: hypothetical protein ACO3UT_05860 [Candidatus Nanopelagicaceae bacterium]
MKRLIIHPGFHKSGTTALQQSLHANRNRLQSYGLSYPFPPHKAHHRLAWSLSGKVWGWRNRGGSGESPRLWARSVRSINRASGKNIIISSEFFSELDSEKINKIKNDINNHEVQVLFTLRPLAKLLSSSYQQYLKYGLKADYEEWLHSVLDKPGESKLSPTFWRRHFHGQVISRWSEVFGPSNVTVLFVDESQPEFLFTEANKYLGLPEKTLQAQDRGLNRSMTTEEIALILEINRRFPKERNWNEYQVFIRNGFIREITDNSKAASGKEKLLTPKWAIDIANNLARDSKNEILKSGVKIIGDIESLDSAEIPSGTSNLPFTIDINTVATAMLSMDKKLISHFPFTWLRWSLVKRLRKTSKRALFPKRS